MTGRLAAFAGAAALAAVPVWAAPAVAQDGECQGVIVVVDRHDENDPEVGCAADPSTGIEALAQAGFEVVEVAAFPGAVCRIDQYPQSACADMPKADASWSYWHADGEEWNFSSSGAGTFDPEDGDIEGWVFGDGSAPPSIEPGQARVAAGEQGAGAETETDSTRSLTWVIGAVALAVIAALVIWRRRRDSAS